MLFEDQGKELTRAVSSLLADLTTLTVTCFFRTWALLRMSAGKSVWNRLNEFWNF
ncbi:hypothetical membrane protein [Syntrophus aciditrophicus SB]|uniref:Hypothetical membrane protein n=1 Tax=Syntrophus aciditrophicus (strain SB) TaxID=56780 RepID=Q2LPS6_SYNAS|nr:hypothetical membrane protein [Syntrophus aciditrophicus SB]